MHTSRNGLYCTCLVVAVYSLFWTQQQAVNGAEFFKLLPNDGAMDDFFGFSVGISGTTAVAGSRFGDGNGIDSGSAYVFDTTTGLQTAKLTANDGAAGDLFGGSVGISGNTAVIGAVSDDDFGSRSGSAYLFNAATGSQLVKLLPDDSAAGDDFGYSVSISGGVAIVGSKQDDDNGENSGSAYLFNSAGVQTMKLIATDGTNKDEFGFSVGISGNTAIIGSLYDDDNGNASGSAYLFDTTTGSQLVKLLPSDGVAGDSFGYSVGISGNTAIVGAISDSDNGAESGSAYLFDMTTGSQLAKLLPSDGVAGDSFGYSVGISGNTAIVGAIHNSDNGTDSGSAYFFDITTGSQLAKILPSDGATGDLFGESVAISGGTAIVGAHLNDDNGTESGSAYLFQVVPEPSTITLSLMACGGLALIGLRRRSLTAVHRSAR